MVRQLPALAVLLLAGVGLLVVTTVDAQSGLVVLGASLLLAAGLRLSLPPRRAGWLVVRSRGLDASLLLVLGAAVVLLAGTIPDL